MKLNLLITRKLVWKDKLLEFEVPQDKSSLMTRSYDWGHLVEELGCGCTAAQRGTKWPILSCSSTDGLRAGMTSVGLPVTPVPLKLFPAELKTIRQGKAVTLINQEINQETYNIILTNHLCKDRWTQMDCCFHGCVNVFIQLLLQATPHSNFICQSCFLFFL